MYMFFGPFNTFAEIISLKGRGKTVLIFVLKLLFHETIQCDCINTSYMTEVRYLCCLLSNFVIRPSVVGISRAKETIKIIVSFN